MRSFLQVGVALSLIGCADGSDEVESGSRTWIGPLDLEGVTETLEDGRFGTVGSLDGSAEAQFAYLAWAAFGPGGGVLAVDQGTRTVKVFDGSGEFQRELGRLGGGPGEYQSPSWIGQCSPTTLSIFDYRLDRITELTPTGDVVATRRIPDRSGYVVDQVRCHPSGKYVITQRDVTNAPREGGRYRVGFLLQTMGGLTGDVVDVGVVWGEDRYRYPSSDMPAPLGASLSIAVAADRIYLTSGAEARVVEIDLRSGDTTRVIEWQALEAAVDDRLRRAVIDADLDQVRGHIPPASLQQRRAFWEDTMFPDRLPETYALFLDDDEEMLWVQVSKPMFRGHDRPSALAGIPLTSPDGARMLQLPHRYTPFAVQSGRLLGMTLDSLDVQHLSVKRIVRPQG